MGDPATDGAFSVDAADTGRPVSAHAGLPPRRLLVLGAGRTLLSTTGVLVVYFVLPLDRRFSSRTLLILVLGLVGVGLLVAWQVRAILRARTPALRAVEALALSLPLFLVLFAVVYVVLSAADAQAFSEPLTHMDSLYFVVTVFATVGFGDIAPVTEMARAITTVQMVGDLLLIGLVLRMFLAAVNQGRRHAQRLSRPASGAASPGGDLGPPSGPPTDGGLITPAG